MSESEYDQKAVDIIQNLAMLVRRLCHKHPNVKLVDQALGYLRGEGLQGTVLREAPTAPESRVDRAFQMIRDANTVTILSLDEMQSIVLRSLAGEFDAALQSAQSPKGRL